MPKYRVGTYGKGPQTAILSDRGLVALMEAGYQQTREQDAALIVHAVNNHDALVEALRHLHGAITLNSSDIKPGTYTYLIGIAEKALADARVTA